MTRVVEIPQTINDRITKLTQFDDELNGVLFYKTSADRLLVNGLFMTGHGSPGHVISSPDRILLVNKFLASNPDLGIVKFHTHTQKTAELYGNQYLRGFSTGDLDSYRDQFKHDKTFIGMLVTPQVKLLCGLDNPSLEMVSDTESRNREMERITNAFENIRALNGIELPRFRLSKPSSR